MALPMGVSVFEVAVGGFLFFFYSFFNSKRIVMAYFIAIILMFLRSF